MTTSSPGPVISTSSTLADAKLVTVIEPPHSNEAVGKENCPPVGWVVVEVVVVSSEVVGSSGVVVVSSQVVVSSDVVIVSSDVVVVSSEVVVTVPSQCESVSTPASPVYSTEAETGGKFEPVSATSKCHEPLPLWTQVP